MNTTYRLATCREHALALEFTKAYKMPKHWREAKALYYPDGKPACQRGTCPRTAEYWFIIDLKDVLPEFIEKGQSRLARTESRKV